MTGFDSKRQASRDLLEQALDALLCCYPDTKVGAALQIKTVADLRAELAQPAVAELLTAEQILGAVARGWCHPTTSSKEMDADLALAIAAEVSALIDAHGIKGSAA